MRRRDLPPEPKRLADLAQLPECYQRTLLGRKFMIDDSQLLTALGEDEDESKEKGPEHISRRQIGLVFVTRRILEILCENETWIMGWIF